MKDLKENLKNNLKGMSLSEKADYIWTYYKIPILAIAFCLIFGISLASTIITSRLSHPVLRLGVNDQVDLFYPEAIDEMLASTFPDSQGYEQPVRISVSTAASTANPYGPVQLAAYLSAGELDAIISDQSTVDYISTSDVDLIVTDISETALGEAARVLGLTPLYYMILPGNNEENALRFLETLKNAPPLPAPELSL